MDKYEFNIKVEQIKKLVNKNDFATAMKIADTIDWRRVRNANLLSMISQVYEKNDEYQEAKEVLLLAFERAPISKRILYKLTELALKEGSLREAEDYYREFCDLAQGDVRQHLLRYMILKESGAPIEQLLRSLERYTETELDEKWMYELAGLYDKAGKSAECIQLCDKIILMFGDGTYVEGARALKQRYAPLTNYEAQRGTYGNYGQQPGSYMQSNPMYDQSLTGYGQGTGNYGQVQGGYAQGGYDQSLGDYGQGPVGYNPSEQEEMTDTQGYTGLQNSYMPSAENYGVPQNDFGPSAGSYAAAQNGYVPDGGGYSVPQDGYVQNGSGYAAPQTGYGAGADSYGTPQAGYAPNGTGYGAGADSYGAPQDSYVPGAGGYGAPQAGYGAGADSYGAPQDSYVPGAGGYGAPQAGYGAGTDSYGAPQDGYIPSGSGYGAPQNDYAPGMGSYAAPQNGYAPGAGNYTPSQNNYMPGTGNYTMSPNSYVPGVRRYGWQGNNYGAVQGSYTRQNEGYLQNDENYGDQAPGRYGYQEEGYEQPDNLYMEENSTYGSAEDISYMPENNEYDSYEDGAYIQEDTGYEQEGQYMPDQAAEYQTSRGWNMPSAVPGVDEVDEELVANLHQAAAEKELAAEMSRISTEGYMETEPSSDRTKVFRDMNNIRHINTLRQKAMELERENEKKYHERFYVPHHLMIEAKMPDVGFETAVEMLKKVHQETGVNNQVIKISGSKLSKRGIFNVSDKLAGKDLIVEEAGDLTPKDLEELQMLLERDETGVIVVLIDNPYQIEELHQQNPGFINLFKCINADEKEELPEEELVEENWQEEEPEPEAYEEPEPTEEEGPESEEKPGEDMTLQEQGEESADEDTGEPIEDQYLEEEPEEEREYDSDEGEYDPEDEEEYAPEDEGEYDPEDEEGYDPADGEGYDPEDEEEYDPEDEGEYDPEDDSEYGLEEAPEYEDEEMEEQYDISEPVDDEEMELNEFAEYAANYAKEIDCSITGKSMLALYERIEVMEEDGIPLTRANAEDLIEEAADRAEKPSLGGLIKGVFSSKYDKDGLLILKEEHFI